MKSRSILAVLALVPRLVAGQSLSLDARTDEPTWFAQWSALFPRGDLPRGLPSAPGATPMLLLLPVPGSGLSWTLGNPATLGLDLPSGRTDFTFALGGQSGAYRRPLDSERARLSRMSALSWGQISPRVTMLGRVTVDRESNPRSSEAVFIDSYGSSPFLTTDTTTSPMRRDRTRLEGISQWNFGKWLVGLTLGYESRDHTTTDAGVVRSVRRAMPGAVVGLARRSGSLTVGVHGAFRYRTETFRLSERSYDTFVYDLQGYRDVGLTDVILQYYRRLNERVPAVGAGVSGMQGGLAWSVGGERIWRRESQTRQQANDPLEDRWDAEGWRAGLSVEPSLGSDRLRLLGQVRYHALNGRGDRALDSADVVFTAEESLLEGRIEGRLLPVERGWTGVAAVVVAREARTRSDSIAAIRSDISTLRVSLQVEAGRTMGGTLIALTLGFAHYQPTAEIPDPRVRGAVYQRLFAPELDIQSRGASPFSIGALARRTLSPRSAVWLGARYERAAPAASLSPFGFGVEGTRTAWSLTGGVTLGIEGPGGR